MTKHASSTPQRITVGFDQTPAAHAALHWAAAEAQTRGATLRIVSAWDPSPITPWNLPDLSDWRDQARTDAEHAAEIARAAAGGQVNIETVAPEGEPGRIMVEESQTADLLVVGSTGHLGLAGMLAGSVSRHCLRRAACTVVVVGPHAQSEITERIVLSSTTDPDGETFGWVAEWVHQRPVPIHVIASFDFPATLRELAHTHAHRQVGDAVRKQNDHWVSVLRKAVGDGVDVSTELLEGSTLHLLQAQTQPGDLIVVPSGCEHLAPFAQGSCPIAVVPPPAAVKEHVLTPMLRSDVVASAPAH